MDTLEAPRLRQQGTTRTFLPEVQALRALAVLLVVVYHFWPDVLPGGYVGVDVFFVISGFLITSHLHRELLTRGTVSLRAFYARRARRLLPASMLVLVVATLATWLFLPVTRWAGTAKEVLASSFYVQNWLLATRAVDYSALDDAASPVQHFWSLSVEEQFYLAWPPLILLLVALARRSGGDRPYRLVLPGILVVTGLSLAYSVYATAHTPSAAYFVTPGRIWELGVGAVLALWMRTKAVSPRTGRGALPLIPPIGLRWGGLAAVLASAVRYSSAAPFPGWLALVPVLGTAAVIAAGETRGRDPLGPLFGLWPTQFLGAVSYSLYLWHWPVLIISPFVLGHAPAWPEKIALIGLSIGVAWATKVLVEDSAQKSRRLATRPALTAVLTALTMAVVAGVAALQLHDVAQRQDTARAGLALADGRPCFGAAALAPGSGCSEVFGPPLSVSLTPEDEPWFTDPACTVTEDDLRVATCRFSAEPPTRRVALVGDSHAEHWRGALHRIAREENWELVEVFQGGCPATAARVLLFDGDGVNTRACHQWGQDVQELLAADPPDYVFTSAFASAYTFAATGYDSPETGAYGFADMWTAWAGTGAQVFVLRDIPTTGDRQVPECVATHPDAPVECARNRDAAFPEDAATAAAGLVESDRIRMLDLSGRFCDEDTCYAVVGGALVYWDANHMSAQFSRTLAPALLELVDAG
ncbi:Peptidoglycan/LPS O-acetylase OafA/YrhL, contains acyltransferase and SGNH-hydrolase domains [Modestobacter sp. DSM 44400]|uniref:acyltransferase family protein n=1 Tax=Modestobacter sp. DSM 44400 TaxID=1550230 RepID=UPI00089C0C5F|nr:acyltransferase family protein [Modestobacter sp. DSM 44400]SDX49808.1 Peptidoglycan/LPS O-acetylase OafA/YrhL, contains acyltransferase and SGNH-hydrolase domains [Modestobacter sp. DSM 44400]